MDENTTTIPATPTPTPTATPVPRPVSHAARAAQQCKDAARLIDAAADLLHRAKEVMTASELREGRSLVNHIEGTLRETSEKLRAKRVALERKGAA